MRNQPNHNASSWANHIEILKKRYRSPITANSSFYSRLAHGNLEFPLLHETPKNIPFEKQETKKESKCKII